MSITSVLRNALKYALANPGAETEMETILNYTSGITAGTQAASKAIVNDANANQGAAKVTALSIGASGSETLLVPTGAAINLLAQGVAAGYKIARGVHTQVAASDTVVTGLATVVAVLVSFSSNPTVKQLFCAATIGDQAGTPAAGSFLLKTFKPTNNTNDVTPIAATDFTDNLGISWIAVGT